MTIAVLGSANIDLVVRTDRLPGPGETIFGSAFTTVPGGKGVNQAVAAQRAGGAVRFVGAVGSDSFGAQLRGALAYEGIDTAALQQFEGESGTAHITVQDSGENSIIVVPGANGKLLHLTEQARESIIGASALVMQFELPQEVLREGAQLAREQGIMTVLTPAPVLEPLPGLLELMDVLVPNQHEVTLLSGIDDVDEATRSLSRGRTVITTLGTDGALVARDGELVGRIPARRVDAVDTTSAGDTFVGVFIACLDRDIDLETSLRWATVASSIGVTRAGATSSMPMWAEIEAVGLDY
ncbi:MAG: ribokinase [Leucobacter sp.]